MTLSLNLLVLRCKNIDDSRLFYEKLGFKFLKEKHDAGPMYFTADVDGLVFELYPLRENEKPDNCKLGFSTASLDSISDDLVHDKSIQLVEPVLKLHGDFVIVVKDPNGRAVEIRQ